MLFKGPRPTSLASGAAIGLAVFGICAGASAGEPYQYVPGQVYNPNGQEQQAAMPQAVPAPPQQSAPQPAPNTAYQQPPYPQPPNNVYLAGAAKSGLPSTTLSADEINKLPERMDRLESLFQGMQNEVINAKAQAAAANKAAADAQKAQQEADKKLASGWWNGTSISGRMYYDFSYIHNEPNVVGRNNSGWGFDIKRFYVGIDHKFDDTFSANITTDFTYDSGAGATQLFIKKAYLDINLDPALDIRLGSTDLPWVPFVEGLYGYRYVEAILIDRTKFGTSADWGIHTKGKLADGMFNYAFSVVNGAGYKKPDIGSHTPSMDFEGRVDFDYDGFVAAIGGYVGDLGKNTEGTAVFHTASRFDAIAAYVMGPVRAGVEYFAAWDWMNVTTPTSDRSDGVSAFASYQFVPRWTVFGRYDYVKPNRETNSDLTDNYFNTGITFSPTKIVDFSLVYKRDHAGDGNLSTANGTIGGLDTMSSGTYDEVGMFGRFRW